MEQQPAARVKLSGREFYEKVLGAPKFVVAPMVDQSELPWRILARRYGAQLAYTPMINAKMYTTDHMKRYREECFNLEHGEEGGPEDRPLIVQFCANDPDQLLASARAIAPHCDAVDLNLGCPQEIAKRGRYGSFLQDDWELIYKLINTLHLNLDIPVTAKFRVFPTVEKTVEYAKMLESAGAQILTCHGRTREQRGQNSGLADWSKIKAVKEAVSVPVFANGNILFRSDIARCLEATGADAVMVAEGQLYNAALFHVTEDGDYHPIHANLALEYLDIVKRLKTPTGLSAVKGHLFKIMRPALNRETDLRDRLGALRSGTWAECIANYEIIAREMKERMERDAAAAPADLEPAFSGGIRVLPHWLAQPYFRPLPPAASTAEATIA
ncbi:dihydrouridine synthase [Exidia glandulosa HHB12029]|uniref:tRNA-dihydrouridine(16/17) synthase [NAD(P)(+)] n=1 Tax=Exidia glandulosa HHB12029 TaxID=1314781 RepID=A0A165NCN6_EXIGL|nr:dihydrouridine synthase [Exidia glandulosa HHB12029]